MTKCDKCCIGNFNGECVNDRCEGALVVFGRCRCASKEQRKKYYEAIRRTFDEDFPQTPGEESKRKGEQNGKGEIQ